MKNNDVIKLSSSPWASPIILVKKKDGSTRFCVDYCQLNDVTKKDRYSLPRIDDNLHTLAGNTWFSTLDLNSGLCNAPARFERLMEAVLKRLSYEACLVYLDDFIIAGHSFEEHLNNIKLMEANLKLSPSKCCLFWREDALGISFWQKVFKQTRIRSRL
ncbi:retrovirus-related Pol polyprotein from transposon 297 [Trichonephila clavipes]|nr:retrovirus-related Pol polyprotein from transposon 297 [Trichonephila clavipes]